jgi:hypothetical protein
VAGGRSTPTGTAFSLELDEEEIEDAAAIFFILRGGKTGNSRGAPSVCPRRRRGRGNSRQLPGRERVAPHPCLMVVLDDQPLPPSDDTTLGWLASIFGINSTSGDSSFYSLVEQTGWTGFGLGIWPGRV